MSIHPKSLFKLFTCLLFTTSVHAITVTDFLGNKISLQKPAKRIIALAPHIVENMFSAGGGDSITGTVRYSDYPEAAKSIPQLGSMGSFGLESIVNLDPDLVIIWHSGSGSEMYSKIKELGIPIYASAPRKISDIAKSIRDYGHLTGNSSTAEVAAIQFEKKYKKLGDSYQSRRPVSTFYQVWNKPILTINNNSLISEVIQLCGGKNVFGESPSLVPKLSIESVIAENPEAIIASGMANERPEWLDAWKEWPNISAVQKENLFFVPPDIIQRHSVRILLGAKHMCKHLEKARAK